MKHRNWLLFLLILTTDQASKRLAADGKILFDTEILSFSFVKNTGASFGILQGTNTYLVWISIIALGLILRYLYDFEGEERTALVAAAAGIIGNLIDRVAYGYVIDFVDLHFWPVFNLADTAIVIGVLYITYRSFKN